MKKIDDTVKKETAYIAAWTLIFSAIMQAVFLVIQKWDYTVLLGNVLGGGAAVLNFLLLGVTVQKALSLEQKDAASLMKSSQMLRMLMLFVAALLGFLLPCFNAWATIIPFFFTRIAIVLRQILDKKNTK